AQSAGQPVGPLGDLGEAGPPARLALERDDLALAEDAAAVAEDVGDREREVLHGREHFGLNLLPRSASSVDERYRRQVLSALRGVNERTGGQNSGVVTERRES